MHHAAPVRPAALYRLARILALFLLALTGITSAQAQSVTPPDAILINGKFVVFGARPAQALAIRDGKISAIGNTATIRALAGASTRII